MYIPENIAGIDYRHMQLESMLDKVCEMLEYGYALFIIEDALDELAMQTETNFSEEEKLMRRYRYENLQSHKSMHKELYAKLTVLSRKLLAVSEKHNKQENKQNLLSFLQTEFRDHMEEDSNAMERGQVAVEHAIKRINEIAVPTRPQMNHAYETISQSNNVMAFRGIFRFSLP